MFLRKLNIVKSNGHHRTKNKQLYRGSQKQAQEVGTYKRQYIHHPIYNVMSDDVNDKCFT